MYPLFASLIGLSSRQSAKRRVTTSVRSHHQGGTMYDYVIVGAGSAGCVVASRLTEDPTVSVLLLEAGGSDKKQEVQIPAAFSKLFKTPLDWNYETEPQPTMKGRKMYWPRGKMLGGSSSMNAMM